LPEDIMIWTRVALGLILALQPLAAQETATGIASWDTGLSSAEPLSPEVLAAKAGWTAIPRDQAVPAFKGDAVVGNGRILVVARKRSPAIEVYSLSAGKAVSRARLTLQAAGSDGALRLERAALVENGKGAAVLEAFFKTAKGADASAKVRLKRGDVAVETSPGAGAERLRVECPTRFAVLPDFFADDVLIDARKIPIASTEVPSENFLMHLLGSGEAIAMAISESREQEFRLTLAGEREKRMITGSEIAFGGKKKIWLALLEGPGIWHSVDLKREDAQKIIPLEWTMPFVAQWRVDFSRPNDLVDGWDMLLQKKKGHDYIKPAWLGGAAEEGVDVDTRKRFTEVLGFFPYPCWSDHERRGFIQPLEVKTRTKFVSLLTYEGPMVLYPLNRLKETPPEAFTVVDAARNALGMGPCEYILDVENQKQEYKGQATCPTREALIAIYEKGQQKAKREEIEKRLKDAHDFVAHIRGRIALYIDFARKVREYLAAQKKARPELKDPIGELEKIAEEMDARFAEREERIKTPAFVAQMNEDFRKNVLDAEGPEALERCKKYAEDLVRIGGNQDKLVSECRWVARTLRQRAGLLVAVDPRLDAVAGEVRARAQEVLRNPSMHERARQ
jgi:hypothetical protein